MNPVPVTFLSDAQPGGTERYLTLLMEGLGSEWIRDVVCLEEGLAERLRARGYPARSLRTLRRKVDLLAAAWELRRLLRSTDTALLHADNLKAALIAVAATRGTEIPVVWVKHDFSWDGWLARLVGRRCEQVIGVSSAVTHTFNGHSRTNVRVVRSGVPELTADREAGRRLLLTSLSPAKPSAIVTLIGRLHPAKGHGELLGALPVIRARVAGAHCVFVGGRDRSVPSYLAELKREVALAGLEDAVTFIDHRDDAVELLSGSDVLVIPTVKDTGGFGREGFSYVAVEAMAVGTPVVGYDHGGLPEVLGDCGLLVPPADRRALAEAIVQLLTDEGLREQLVRCGRRRVTEEFPLSRTVAAMKETYREAAKAGAGNGWERRDERA
jgi:glycosyltransferase involved in cell wall biosynthesis